MNKLRIWRKSLMAVGLGLGVMLFVQQLWLSYLAARDSGWHIFAHPEAVALVFICGLLVYVAQMIAWQFTLKYLDIDLSLPKILEGFQLSFLPRYIPGSIWGYLSRSQWLEQLHGVSYSASFMGSLLETVSQALTALVVGLGCLGLTLSGPSRWLFVGSAAGLFALVCLIGPFIIPMVGQRITKNHLFTVRTTSLWLWVIIANLALRLVYGLSFLGVVWALIPSAAVDWPTVVAASNLSWLLGFVIPFVPTGIGVREWALARLLVTPNLTTMAEANLAAVMFRFALILTELIWLAIGVGLYARRWRTQAVSRAIFEHHNGK